MDAMSTTPRFPALAYSFALLFALAALAAAWYWVGRPVDLPDAATPTHKLQCASYTPFDKDQSPFQQPFVLRKERVDADLALLAQRFTCIRTYSADRPGSPAGAGAQAWPEDAGRRLGQRQPGGHRA